RLLAAVVLAGLATAAATEAPGPVPGACVDLMVPMRDGVRLSTLVCLPAGDGPWATVLNRTPYGKSSSYVDRYREHGFARVSQDPRGRWDSGGEYVPPGNEVNDGYDAVEWIADQPWSNGRVGMSGYSALGIATYMAAAADPPHLVAAFAAVAPESLFYEGRFIGGMWKEADSGGWLRARGLSAEQIAEYPRRATLDDRWRRIDFIFQRHRVDIPIYHVGGWYDLFLNGTLNNFRFLQEWGAPGARGRQKVLIGPFGHSSLSGELEYPEGGGGWRRLEEELRWFDHWLAGVDNGVDREPPVRWYQRAAARRGEASAANGYRSSPDWPPPGSVPTRLYLQPGGGLSFTPPEIDRASTQYRADPSDPVPTLGGLNLNLSIGPKDQRPTRGRSDVLRFESEPLTEPLALAGRLEAELWAATDGPDTDFIVKLVDVYPDGYEALVLDAGLRARYRDGRRPQDVREMTPGVAERLDIDLWHTGLVFEAGHRIAVHVQSSNAPRFDVNPQNGDPPGERLQPPRVATNTIYHDRRRPSALLVPVLHESAPPGR
ncbi:MAG: CocE/NonD family hydrolase, partial [Thermoanaerobaculia bacterium]|nr:CocE/NonD family hydrolase [Thermoanaerobaculia bacterium]